MKKALLTVLIALMLIVPAYAASDNGEPATTANTYKVYDFAGLQNALDKTNDGDTIELQNPITISESIIIGSSDKHITIKLKPSYNDTNRIIFNISYEGGIKAELRNITFDFENIQSGGIISSFGDKLLIDNCVFKNIITNSDYIIFGENFTNEQQIIINNSNFENVYTYGTILKFGTKCNTVISDCTFSDIRSSNNTLIYSGGIISLSANYFPENTVDDYYITIDNRGTLYLDTDMSQYAKYYGYEPQGWYKIIEKDWMADDDSEPFTTEKVEVDSINESCRVAFFTEENKEPVIVASLEELQAAIDAADDGDTIAVSQEINLSGQELTTDKQINLIRAEGYTKEIFCLNNGATIDNFTFIADGPCISELIDIDFATSQEVNIRNCIFKRISNDSIRFIFIGGGITANNKVVIEKCQFYNSSYGAVSIRANTDVVIDSCVFVDCKGGLPGGAVDCNGKLLIKDTSITGGSAPSGGGVYCNGELTITNSQIRGNSTDSPKYGADIFCTGKLTITDEQQEDAGFYNEITCEKIELPLVDHEGDIKLIYLTTEQAVEYFAPPQDDDSDPDDPDEENDDTLPEEPQGPGEQDEDTDTPDDENTPQEPAEDTTQEPPHTGSSDNNYTPSRPSKPDVAVEDEPEQEPEETEQPPEDESALIRQLVCGEARIDTNKTIVLLGYGDGLLHEDDPLTRAQMATIIYRLLDDDTIARYSNAELTFTDVAPGAWYTSYVSVIQAAGIVNGVADGLYDPNGIVTWAQIITVLSRFVEPEDYALQYIQYDGWAQEPIQTAVALGWIEDSAEFEPDAIISRGALVQLVNGVLALYR